MANRTLYLCNEYKHLILLSRDHSNDSCSSSSLMILKLFGKIFQGVLATMKDTFRLLRQICLFCFLFPYSIAKSRRCDEVWIPIAVLFRYITVIMFCLGKSSRIHNLDSHTKTINYECTYNNLTKRF